MYDRDTMTLPLCVCVRACVVPLKAVRTAAAVADAAAGGAAQRWRDKTQLAVRKKH